MIDSRKKAALSAAAAGASRTALRTSAARRLLPCHLQHLLKKAKLQFLLPFKHLAIGQCDFEDKSWPLEAPLT